MIRRIAIYVLIINTTIFGATRSVNQLHRDIYNKEFNYLFLTLEAKIRVNNINLTKVNKDIAQMTKDLGKYNKELNPYK